MDMEIRLAMLEARMDALENWLSAQSEGHTQALFAVCSALLSRRALEADLLSGFLTLVSPPSDGEPNLMRSAPLLDLKALIEALPADVEKIVLTLAAQKCVLQQTAPELRTAARTWSLQATPEERVEEILQKLQLLLRPPKAPSQA